MFEKAGSARQACGEALRKAAHILEGIAATAIDNTRVRRRAADLRTLADVICAYIARRPHSLRSAPDALIFEGAAAVDRLEPFIPSIAETVKDQVDLQERLIPELEEEEERRTERV